MYVTPALLQRLADAASALLDDPPYPSRRVLRRLERECAELLTAMRRRDVEYDPRVERTPLEVVAAVLGVWVVVRVRLAEAPAPAGWWGSLRIALPAGWRAIQRVFHRSV